MAVRVGINGFGRMGRLALRAAWDWPELDIVHVNEAKAGAACAAHLLEYDTVHGRWNRGIEANGKTIRIDDRSVEFSEHRTPGEVPWKMNEIEIVLECSGIVDGPATMVVDGKQLKVLAWYDNEVGYVHRMMELAKKVALTLAGN